MRFILAFASFVGSFSLFGQEHTITGKVTDKQLNPIGYANILLLQAQDSVLVKGNISNDLGAYVFENLPTADYIIQASFMGYVTRFSDPFRVDADFLVPTMVMEEDVENLDAVVVNAPKPTISRQVDRLVFNVENTTLSTGTTFDLLKRTPGVIVNQGELRIQNRPATVYINDRKVYLTSEELNQLLEGFSAENIKSIEVITTPPAKYDAEGGAILNIVTSKNVSLGYKGSVYTSYTQAILPKNAIGMSHYYKNNWLNAYGSYNYTNKKDYKADDERIRFFNTSGEKDQTWDTDFTRKTKTYAHNLNSILDFTLTEASTLSVTANLLFTPKEDSDIKGLTQIYSSQGNLDSLYNTTSTLKKERNNHLFNVDYTTALGENGTSLSAKANYINYHDERFQEVATLYSYPDTEAVRSNSFYTEPDQKSHIYTGQVDLVTTLGKWGFETGVKFSGIKSESEQSFYDTNGTSPVSIMAFSDAFDYDENIYAAYVNFAQDWEKWSVQLGLREEYTDVTGNSLSLGLVNNQNYFELFPTAYLMYTPSENHSFGFTYDRGITRPRFESLNPFRYFINENSFDIGNPNISPAISNYIKLHYTYKNQLTFELYYSREDDAMVVLPFQNNSDRTFRTVSTNAKYKDQISLDISYSNYVMKGWYLYTYSSLFDENLQFVGVESGNQEVSLDNFGVFNQILNFITLSEDQTLTAEISTSFLSNILSGSYLYNRPQFGLDLGLQKTFLDNRLTLSVNAEDVFNTNSVPLTSQYLNQDIYYYTQAELQRVRVGLRYNFGNFRLSDNNRPAEAEEVERLEKKDMP